VESAEQFIDRKKREFEEAKKRGALIPMKDIGRKGKWYFVREAATLLISP
jgi:hypothetical protein